MARPLSSFGDAVRKAIDAAAGGVVTWRSIAHWLDERGYIDVGAPAELKLVKRHIENLVRAGYLIPDGRVASKTRPLMGYRTAAAMQQRAQASGTQMPGTARRDQQREAVEQLLLAWGA